ncbi:MAG: B12-binding domain-containing radical SAM protein [Nannocystaceae bacterium]|nr:B12-binding domain-containing radical SAM protein [Nannocystaceae bacterium]
MSERARATIRARLADEVGTLGLGQPADTCLVYPSPYRVGMSSLGFQTLYRGLWEAGWGCHRAFLPDEWAAEKLPWPPPPEDILSYEAQRPIADYRVLGFSVAYELEIAGLLRMLAGAGIPVLASQRRERDPIVLGGGPLTDTNASCLLPFVDVLVCGEADALLPQAIQLCAEARDRDDAIAALSRLPHTAVGERTPGQFAPLPACATAPRELLPAYSAITTPHTELADMFLVEPERGCSRRCTFCVMRGASTGGMRLLPMERALSVVPQHARRVGLVGAAVTDHPELEALVSAIVDAGRGVGVSSLRADRLTPRLVDALARGGYRQLTVASDGISERLRTLLQRKISAADLRHAAELVRDHGGLRGLKIYQMVGVPTETDEDVAELVEQIRALSRITRVTLGISTFVPKRNTPLDGQPFAGVETAAARLQSIARGLRGAAQMRPQSPKWAHVEWLIARHGPEGGHAALAAVRAGGSYRAWVDAFAQLGAPTRPWVFGDEAALARRRGRAAIARDRLPLAAPDGGGETGP